MIIIRNRNFCCHRLKNVSVKTLKPSSAIKWLTNANECCKRAAETSLGIGKGLVNVRNVNVFINELSELSATLLKTIFLTTGNNGQ